MKSLNNLFTFFFFFGLVLPLPASANPEINFALKRKSISEWERSQFDKFIVSGTALIPSGMRDVLGAISEQSPIELEFKKLDNELDLSGLDSTCEHSDLKTEIKLGDVYRGMLASKSKMHLSEHLFHEILKGPQSSTTYTCGHKTGYRLALATLLHELAHLYDDEVKISSQRRFRHLMTFSKGFFDEQKNINPKRTPNIYEFRSPSEAFAVNFEYFIMDPDFQCRRPALYEFFTEALNYKPYANRQCVINNKVTVIGQVQQSGSLDLNRLYRVDYLLADEGSSMDSMYGHSMLRLVFCAPKKEKSEKCVTDVSSHIIVSFRGSLTEGRASEVMDEQNVLKKSMQLINKYLQQAKVSLLNALNSFGLFGQMPSHMYLLLWETVRPEYNDFDFRNLVSTPLNLSEDEKRSLLNRILEINWGYSGSYNFFTNNCKSEVLDLLKAVVRNKKIEEVNAITPVGLREELINSGFAIQKNETTYISSFTYTKEDLRFIRDVFFFRSFPEDEAGIAEFLAKASPIDRKVLEKYAKSYTGEQRRQFINSVIRYYESHSFVDMPLAEYRNLLLSIAALEVAAKKYHRRSFFYVNHYVQNYLMNGDINQLNYYLDLSDDEFKIFENEMNILRQKDLLLSAHSNVLKSGYGIPRYQDYLVANEAFTAVAKPKSSAASSDLTLIEQQVTRIYKGITEPSLNQLNQTEENINNLRDFAGKLAR